MVGGKSGGKSSGASYVFNAEVRKYGYTSGRIGERQGDFAGGRSGHVGELDGDPVRGYIGERNGGCQNLYGNNHSGEVFERGGSRGSGSGEGPGVARQGRVSGGVGVLVGIPTGKGFESSVVGSCRSVFSLGVAQWWNTTRVAR